MNNGNKNILDQIAEDPFVQAAWKIRVAWTLFKIAAVVFMFLKIVLSK